MKIFIKEKKDNKKIILLIGYLITHIIIFFTIFKENNLEKW